MTTAWAGEKNFDELFAFSRKIQEERKAKRSSWLEKAPAGEANTFTIKDYIQAGSSERWMFDNACERIWRVVFAEPGIVRVNYNTLPKRAKALGLSQDEELYVSRILMDEFFDMERALHRLTLFALNGARGGEAARQIFAMFGPAGSAKSQLAEAMKRHLTDAVFFHIEGCPIFDHPLWLVPKSTRDFWSKELGVRIPQDKDICPKCRELVTNKDGYNEEWEKVRVEAATISIRQKRGIDVVPPFELNTMGTEVLIGEDQFWLKQSEIKGRYGRWLYGAFGHSKGGINELREMFRMAKEGFHLYYMATQEQQFPSPKYLEYCSSDFMIIGHANIPQVRRNRGNEENDALFDRIYFVITPYSVSHVEQGRIHRKMLSRTQIPHELTEEERESEELEKAKIKKSFLVPNPVSLIYDKTVKVHDGPGALGFANQIAALSHLHIDLEQMSGPALQDLLKKLAGEDETSGDQIREYREAHPLDGLHGFSPRFMIKILEDVEAEALLRWEPAEGSLAGSKIEEYLRSEPCMNMGDVKRASLASLWQELILATEADSRKDQARIQAQINLFKGTFIELTESGLKRRFFEDFKGAGLLEKTLGSGTIAVAKQAGVKKYIDDARTFTERKAKGEQVESDLTLTHYLESIELYIEGRRKEYIGNRDVFREIMVQKWNEQVARHKNLHPSDQQKDDPLLQELEVAVETDIFAARSEEFCAKIADYVESFASKHSLKENVLKHLPDYYCTACLLWTMKVLRNPQIRI